MLTSESIQDTIEAGTAKAKEIQAFRARELRRRARAIGAATPARQMRATVGVSADLLQAAGPPALGTLVAEGDSWFDYPFHDILRYLEDDHGYDVESIARKGDRIEEMAYGGGQLEEFARRLEKLLRRGEVPVAILLSGGGNDLAGDEFAMLLNHRESAVRGLNEAILQGVIDERLKAAYVTIIATISEVSQQKLGRKIPILVHGYDYPYPDGRGFAGGWGFLPGPWLEPGFRQKGFEAMDERRQIVFALIDRFNDMLGTVAELPAFEHVRWVDLRGTLTDPRYKNDWANEMHPTKKGFQAVTSKFIDVLQRG